jgi:RNA recognition motif-containing protein
MQRVSLSLGAMFLLHFKDFSADWATYITPRFAFVDFTSTEHATVALIHPKNHQLDGRKLVVEYASADAVRRGGGAGHKPRKKSTEVHGEGHSRRKTRDSVVDDEVNEKGPTTTTTTTTTTSTPSKAQKEKSTATDRRSDRSAKPKVTNETRTRKSKSSRPAPGAALALAKREQVAIVPSQGRRITFDD